MSREAHYRLLFDLAWDNHGLTLDISRVPDPILQLFVQWRNERVEAENSKIGH